MHRTTSRRLRIAVVSPVFPVSSDLTRGLPIYRTVLELNKLAEVAVFAPLAVYPKRWWLQPRSYLYNHSEVDFQVDGLNVTYLRYQALPGITRLLNGKRVSRCLLQPVQDFQPDVILAYWLYPEGYGAHLVAQKLGVPFVGGARGSDLLHLPDMITRWLVRQELSNASAMLTVSKGLKVRVTQLGGMEDRVRVVLNGCDRTQFYPSDRMEARRAFGVDENSEVVLFVGHLVPVKGVKYLLQAAIELAVRRPNLELVMVGDGAEENLLRDMLAASASSLRVRFLPTVAPPDVAKWMAACDVFCLPSLNEGCPNVLIEVLCCGRPVVASRVGAAPDLVSSENGLLVSPRDCAGLTAALDQILSREWDADAIAKTNLRSWGDVAKETFEVCQTAVRVRDGSPVQVGA